MRGLTVSLHKMKPKYMYVEIRLEMLPSAQLSVNLTKMDIPT